MMLLCAIIGFVRIRKLHGSTRLLALQAAFSVLIEVTGTLTKHFQNHVFFNIYIPLDFFTTLFIARSLIGSGFSRIAIPASIVFLLSFITELIPTGARYMAYKTITVYWTILAIVYFWVLLLNIRRRPGPYSRGIYLVAGMSILFYCCMIPKFGLFKYIIDFSLIKALELQVVLMSFSVVRYTVYIIGIWYLSQPSTPESRALQPR